MKSNFNKSDVIICMVIVAFTTITVIMGLNTNHPGWFAKYNGFVGGLAAAAGTIFAGWLAFSASRKQSLEIIKLETERRNIEMASDLGRFVGWAERATFGLKSLAARCGPSPVTRRSFGDDLPLLIDKEISNAPTRTTRLRWEVEHVIENTAGAVSDAASHLKRHAKDKRTESIRSARISLYRADRCAEFLKWYVEVLRYSLTPDPGFGLVPPYVLTKTHDDEAPNKKVRDEVNEYLQTVAADQFH